MPEGVVSKIMNLLDEERAAIKSASFDALNPLVAHKEKLFDLLATQGARKADLAKIQRRLDENQTLLAAAIAGVNAARGRIAALQNVRDGLSVYDQSGHMAKVSMLRPDLEKKA